MSQEIDFEQLIDLLDRALASKDPKVIKALKKFLFIAALATEDTGETGPFAQMIERIADLERRVGTLEFPNYNPTPCTPMPGTAAPGWTWINTTTDRSGIETGSTSVSASSSITYSTPASDNSQTFQCNDDAIKSFYSTPTSITTERSSCVSTTGLIDKALDELDKLVEEK